jgi:hypothetical protein
MRSARLRSASAAASSSSCGASVGGATTTMRKWRAASSAWFRSASIPPGPQQFLGQRRWARAGARHAIVRRRAVPRRGRCTKSGRADGARCVASILRRVCKTPRALRIGGLGRSASLNFSRIAPAIRFEIRLAAHPDPPRASSRGVLQTLLESSGRPRAASSPVQTLRQIGRG